jgi:hypothetical protein
MRLSTPPVDRQMSSSCLNVSQPAPKNWVTSGTGSECYIEHIWIPYAVFDDPGKRKSFIIWWLLYASVISPKKDIHCQKRSAQIPFLNWLILKLFFKYFMDRTGPKNWSPIFLKSANQLTHSIFCSVTFLVSPSIVFSWKTICVHLKGYNGMLREPAWCFTIS